MEKKSIYKLWNDDVLLLDHVVNLLREDDKKSTANDLELLKNRIKYMLENAQ